MSVIVNTVVPEGIVVCADTRMIMRNPDRTISYDDTVRKIMPFPNHLVVSFCGSAIVTDSLTIKRFLRDLRKQIGMDATITTLPLQLLNAYFEAGGIYETKFLISGLSDSGACITYAVNTKYRTIKIMTDSGSYKPCYGGVTDVVRGIMGSDIDYEHLSLHDAADLTQTAVRATIAVSKHCKEQIVGGECNTYVINASLHMSGWLQPDGEVRSDIAVEKLMGSDSLTAFML